MRYTREELERLRSSPLVVKPAALPPAEEWMGPPQDRNQTKQGTERSRNNESTLIDQTNRRPVLERHISRSTANPEDIVLGPPKTSFASATSLRNTPKPLDSNERPLLPRDADSRERFNFRRPDTENERLRDGRGNNLRVKRGDGEDSDGWEKVKPRKSFGAEGAERFNGRMGGDRHRDDRRVRERDERDVKDRQPRGFETYSREKEPELEDRRNGFGRGRTEPSWFKDNGDAPPTPGDRRSTGDKVVDRSRGWREKERDEKANDRGADRVEDRGDRRWDRDNRDSRDSRDNRDNRDRRQERDPEWMDEPADEKKRGHTAEDFQKWKDSMNAGNAKTPAAEDIKDGGDGGSSFFGLEKVAKVETPLVMDTGPDKFFGSWNQENDSASNTKKEGMPKSNTVGKASRFTSFFAPQEEPQRRQTEPPPPMPALPKEANIQSNKEKEDFQKLLQKLQSQSFGMPSTTPPANQASQPKPPPQPIQSTTPLPLLESFQQYRPERQEPRRPSSRDAQQAALQDLLGNRSTAVSQPSSRPEQMVHDLVNQRQNALSQASSRPDQDANRNAAFLMGLMQNVRAAPEPLRSEQLMMRMPPPHQQPDRQMQEREQGMQREQRERASAQRQRRPEAPPGFYDEGLFQRGPPNQHDGNPNSRGPPPPPPQPTQILQRPPPGLDQLQPGWGAPTQLPPPMSQQRHIAPPPGLPGGRGMPMPQNMFPPGFPIGGFGPPPDGMAPRNMPPPPPGFMMPPPGFMPPMSGYPGPEGMAYGGGPFDGRGAPQGNFRRQ